MPGPSQPHAFGDAIYRKFFGGYAEEMYLHDAQGRILDVNQAACDNSGYTRQELLGMCITDFSADYDLARLQQLWTEYPVGENMVTANAHRRKDGHIYHVNVHLTCQMHEGQKYFLAVGHCTDEQRSREREIEHLNHQLQTLVEERTRQLKESTWLLDTVMQQIPDAIFIKDLQGCYLYGNPSLEVYLGQPMAQVLGRTDAQLLQASAAAAYAASDALTLQRQEAGWFELPSGMAGQSRIFHVMKTPYRDDSGAVIGLLGIARDITDARKAEIEIAHNYEMLRQAERVARIGSWTLELSTNTFTASEMLTEMNGLRPEDPPLTPQTLASMIPAQEHAILSAAIGECIQHGTSYTIDVQHKHPLGGHFPGRIRGQAYRDAQGKITMLHGTLQDLTEHVEAEERLQSLADNLPNGAIFRCEQAGHDRLLLRYVSAGIHALLGITAQSLMAHQNMFAQLVDVADRQAFFSAMFRAMQTQTPFVHVCRMRHADGQIRWMRTRAISRRTHNAEYWEGILLDITAEHEAQCALHAAKEAAEAGERAKSEFLATMSHEIRTPMNTVIGMTQLLQQTEMTAKQRNYLNKVSLSASALLNIINEILDFSKLEAEMLHIDAEPFALDALIDAVVTVTGLQAEQKGVRMVYDIDDSVPRQLIGDLQRLSQVLTNLVGNAIKFTERGEVLVRMHAQPLPHTTQDLQLHVSVRDTGIGIHTAHMQQLFRPFTQAETHTSRRFGGTGLGLAICHKLVHLMEGDISVQSQLGQGSTFRFHVRLQASASVPPSLPWEPSRQAHAIDPLATDAPSQRLHLPASLRGRRVLAVDDNRLNREVAQDFLELAHMHVTTASSGPEALSLLEQASFDLVLLDIQMPEMDGLEVARRIRQNPRWQALPIWALTAQAQETDRRAIVASGMNGQLTKPINAQRLYQTLEQALAPGPSSEPGGSASSPAATPTPAPPSASSLQRQFGAQPERLQRLLRAFVRDFAQAPEQLQHLHQQQDWKGLAMLAHTLKGSLGYLAQSEAVLAMHNLELACQQQAVPMHLQRSASQALAHVLQQVLQQLEAPPAPHTTPTPTTIDHRALMAQITQALPAIRRGEYAGIRTLEQVEAQLRGSPTHSLAARALALTEDLETEAACDCLQQLHQALAPLCT